MCNTKYDQLRDPKYGKLTGVLQNSLAGAYLVPFWKERTGTEVAHMHWSPGIVNAQTVKPDDHFESFPCGLITGEKSTKSNPRYRFITGTRFQNLLIIT